MLISIGLKFVSLVFFFLIASRVCVCFTWKRHKNSRHQRLHRQKVTILVARFCLILKKNKSLLNVACWPRTMVEKQEKAAGVQLPVARVKKIIKSDPDVNSISSSAVGLVARATVNTTANNNNHADIVYTMLCCLTCLCLCFCCARTLGNVSAILCVKMRRQTRERKDSKSHELQRLW